MYSRILVPFDGSPTSEQALKEAAGLARLAGAQLRLLHIVDPLAHISGFERPETYSQDVLPAALRTAQALLDRACEQLHNQGIRNDSQLLENLDASVAQLVVEHARQWGAQLIVLGTQGRRGLERLLMGSDAEQIARTSPVPVLLVRQHTPAAPTAPTPSVP